MASKKTQLSYVDKNTPIHRLSGATKLLMTLLISFAAMITFDTRLLAFIVLLSFVMFAMAQVPWRNMQMIITFIGVIMLINIVVTYLFAPEEGVRIYGTRTEIVHLFGRYYLTWEQLFIKATRHLSIWLLYPLL